MGFLVRYGGLQMNNTLFLLTSLDGKITTGYFPSFDFDKDFVEDPYLSKGLQQYYDIEKMTDAWSVVSTSIINKLGGSPDIEKWPPRYVPVNFIVIGNTLTHVGMQHIADKCESATFVLTDKYKANVCRRLVNRDNVEVIQYDILDPRVMFDYFYNERGAQAITVQTGGTLNRLFFAHKCIQNIDLVVAPTIIGGENTTSMVGGWDRKEWSDLEFLPHLEVVDLVLLRDNYVRMRYKVIDES